MTFATPTVELGGVDKRFRSTQALDAVDLHLTPGITGRLGTNGAGKTTMLRILATVLRSDAGTVRILGRDPARPDQRTEIRRRLGYQPQELGFPRGFTAAQFVDYLAILKEWDDRAQRRSEVERVLALVGLDDLAARRISRLSGGQRRRVALAQALLGRPEVLVPDEPTTGWTPSSAPRSGRCWPGSGRGPRWSCRPTRPRTWRRCVSASSCWTAATYNSTAP